MQIYNNFPTDKSMREKKEQLIKTTPFGQTKINKLLLRDQKLYQIYTY